MLLLVRPSLLFTLFLLDVLFYELDQLLCRPAICLGNARVQDICDFGYFFFAKLRVSVVICHVRYEIVVVEL